MRCRWDSDQKRQLSRVGAVITGTYIGSISEAVLISEGARLPKPVLQHMLRAHKCPTCLWCSSIPRRGQQRLRGKIGSEGQRRLRHKMASGNCSAAITGT